MEERNQTPRRPGGSQEGPEIQEQLEGNWGGEPNGDAKKPWHEFYASEGDAGENATMPDHKQRDNWGGKRGWWQSISPWCCERCQLQNKGKPATDVCVQMDIMGSKWQSHLNSLLPAPVGSDLWLGVCLWCKCTSSQVGVGFCASTQQEHRDAVSRTW